MESILDWNTKEGMIFRGGSGSGINLSNIRGSMEHLSKGGLASGPGQLHARRRRLGGDDQVRRQDPARGEDGRARRRPPRHRGLHLVQGARGGEGRRRCATPASTCRSTARASHSIQYQNANNSVRVTDEFMEAVEARRRLGADRPHRRRADRRRCTARELMSQIADAAWRCADPGVQYDTTINRWHTCPESGRINASNPCSRVHARRRLGLQPRLAQPDEVPPRGRQLRRRRTSSTPSTSSSSPRRSSSAPSSYPTEEIGRQRARVPPARPRLRQPRRAADVGRPALRLRRGPRRSPPRSPR